MVDETRLSLSGDGKHPRIAVDHLGRAHVVWLDQDDRRVRYKQLAVVESPQLWSVILGTQSVEWPSASRS